MLAAPSELNAKINKYFNRDNVKMLMLSWYNIYV